MPSERKRSNNSAGMDSRIFPMDGSEPRTPMAWQQRNLNYQQQQQQQQTQQIYHTNTMGYDREIRQQRLSSSQPPPPQPVRVSEEVQTTGRGRRSSSSTATSSSSSTERASKNSRQQMVHSAPPPLPAYQAFGGTWDGEPCPVHHHHTMHPVMTSTPLAPQHLMQPPQHLMQSPQHVMQAPQHVMHQAPQHMTLPPPQVQQMMMQHAMATLPRRPPAYDKNVVMLLPPMLRPRPLVMPAAEGPPEPLPVRDPKLAPQVAAPTLPRKEGSASSEKSIVKDQGGCRGHSVVLWFIITIITIGVLLGAVLRFVMG